MDEFYRVPLSSAEALATLAVLRALHGLAGEGGGGAAGILDTDIAPDVLESAAERIAAEVPEFVAAQADRLAGTLAHALVVNAAEITENTGDQRTEPPFPIGRTRRLLEDAFERRAPVEIEYYVQSRREWTARRVEITDVHERGGSWYLSGQCGMRGDFRRFRLENIRAIRVLDAEDEDGETNPFIVE